MFTRVLLLTIRETCNKSQTPYNFGNLQMQQSLKMTKKTPMSLLINKDGTVTKHP